MDLPAAQTAALAILARTGGRLDGVRVEESARPTPTRATDIALRLQEIDPTMPFADAQHFACRIASKPGAMAFVELRAHAGEPIESALRRLRV